MFPLFGFLRKTSEPVLPDDDSGGIIVLMDPTLDSKLVVYHEPRSHPSEQYRSFRTNLQAMNPGDSPRTLLFTSTSPDEGKSTTLANIALSLAEFEHLKICLIDMDVRAPRIHELFGIPRSPGITDILLDRVNPRQAMVQGGPPNLTIIPAGRMTAKPAEVTGSDYVQDLIAYLKQDYNYILVDSPPCGVFGDASEVSKYMDGVLLIVVLGDTMKRDADAALETLNAAGGNVVGSFVIGTESADGKTVVADVTQV